MRSLVRGVDPHRTEPELCLTASADAGCARSDPTFAGGLPRPVGDLKLSHEGGLHESWLAVVEGLREIGIKLELHNAEPSRPRTVGLPRRLVAARLDLEPSAVAVLDSVAGVRPSRKKVGIPVVVAVADQGSREPLETVYDRATHEAGEARRVKELLKAVVAHVVEADVDLVEHLVEVFDCPKDIASAQVVRKLPRKIAIITKTCRVSDGPLHVPRHPMIVGAGGEALCYDSTCGFTGRKRFDQSCGDIDRLLEIHSDLGGSGKGRRHRLEVLNKSGIVLLTALEAYCEDIAAEGIAHLVEHGDDWTKLPVELQKQVAAELKRESHELAVWQLAGDGWKNVLTDRLELWQEERNRRLNTPKTEKVDEMFHRALGIESISSGWYWKGVSREQAAKKLDRYVTLRGAIAHRGAAAKSVKRTAVTDYYGHVKRLVGKTGDAVNTTVKRSTDVPLL